MKYQVITKDGKAKRARMETVHGVIETPVFMNVGTVGAIKGAVSTDDLHPEPQFRLLQEYLCCSKDLHWIP